jgi:hypothetical protein
MPEKKKPSFSYKLFSKVPAIKHWLDNRAARLELQKLDKKYQELEAKEKDPVERGRLQSSWLFELDSIADPIESENSERLVAQARKYHILVPRVSDPSEDWYRSQTMGGWILRKDTEARLRREIRDQKRALYDEFRKWMTFTFGSLAFILALVSLLIKTKQPDPCPHNYYRNDAGACVFALAPKTQAAPTETPEPKKHSDKATHRKPVRNPKNPDTPRQ